MSMLNGLFSVSGASVKFAQFRSDRRVGRVNFLIYNLGLGALVIHATEAFNDGTSETSLGAAVTVAPGGVQTLSVSVDKSLLRLYSDSTNVNSGTVRIDVQYIGTTFQGNLSIDEALSRSGFSGADLTGDGLDNE